MRIFIVRLYGQAHVMSEKGSSLWTRQKEVHRAGVKVQHEEAEKGASLFPEQL